ncbi:Serine/threonine-protein phosphatase 7 [Schistosoma japonicum]|nr:Serine/threonine-protein phosphatase 7 [Schistosoma japonicum]
MDFIKCDKHIANLHSKYINYSSYKNENSLANEIFELQSHLFVIVQACHFKLSSVNLYSLMGKLETVDYNMRVVRLKSVISRLIKLLNNNDIKSFDVEKFLASFRFVEIQKRAESMFTDDFVIILRFWL